MTKHETLRDDMNAPERHWTETWAIAWWAVGKGVTLRYGRLPVAGFTA